MIYLDNCATTKVRPEVAKSMMDILTKDFGNPSSLHSMGLEIENKIDNARSIIANYLNVSPDEIYFTSGGTESNNIIIQSVINKNLRNKGKIICSKLEHSSVAAVMKLAVDFGYEVKQIGSDKYGAIDIDELKNAIDENTILISLVHVNNELGAISDLKAVGELKEKLAPKAHFHIDAIQSFGKLRFNLLDFNCDSLSASSHKIHGPKGVGFLYLRKNVHIKPLIYGGGQENNLRSGTENTPGIIGFGKAVEIMAKNFDEEYIHKAKLRQYFVDKINNEIKDFRINTDLENSCSAIINISFPKTKGEVLLHFLEADEIYISTSAACSSNKKSKTCLEILGYDKNITESSIRICFSYENTLKDVDILIEKLKNYVAQIRKIRG